MIFARLVAAPDVSRALARLGEGAPSQSAVAQLAVLVTGLPSELARRLPQLAPEHGLSVAAGAHVETALLLGSSAALDALASVLESGETLGQRAVGAPPLRPAAVGAGREGDSAGLRAPKLEDEARVSGAGLSARDRDPAAGGSVTSQLASAQVRPPAIELAAALRAALAGLRPPAPSLIGGQRFAWGTRTFVMGVVNATPDSFSDGGQYLEPQKAIAHGVALAQAGAHLLDVGGESTRPGAAAVSAQEELRRVLPVLAGLRRAVPTVPLSIDTMKAEVARAALAAGAVLVNDVTGLGGDPDMAQVVAAAQASCCLMHMQGTPRTMQLKPAYDDVVEEVALALAAAVSRATAAGIPRERLLVDPGIGFGKTLGHNLFLLRHLAELRALGLPLLVGTSRKSFLGTLTGGKSAAERGVASAASCAVLAALNGADVVRVHDVPETIDALAVADAIAAARDGGARFAADR